MIIKDIQLNDEFLLRVSKMVLDGQSMGRMQLLKKDPISGKHIKTGNGFGFTLHLLSKILHSLIVLGHSDSNVRGLS